MKKILTVLLSLILGAAMLVFAACASPSGRACGKISEIYMNSIKELPKRSSFMKWDRLLETMRLLRPHNGSIESCLVTPLRLKANDSVPQALPSYFGLCNCM